MPMETIELEASIRTQRRKGGARAMRREGKLPAVLYGPKRTSLAIAVDAKEFVVRGATGEGSHLIRLQSAEPEIGGRLALVKDVQHDPVSGAVVHADLYEVDVHTKIRVEVPLHFVGRAAGVELGGILQPIRRSVEVNCLPTDIPSFLEVDVTLLGIHDAVHMTQIAAPDNVELVFDTDEPVVTVLPPTVEEVKVAAPEGEEEAPAEAAPAAAKAEPAKGAE